MVVGGWVCLLAPLAGFLAILLLGTRITRRQAGFLSTASVFVIALRAASPAAIAFVSAAPAAVPARSAELWAAPALVSTSPMRVSVVRTRSCVCSSAWLSVSTLLLTWPTWLRT